jgi:hypothetical protein
VAVLVMLGFMYVWFAWIIGVVVAGRAKRCGTRSLPTIGMSATGFSLQW